MRRFVRARLLMAMARVAILATQRAVRDRIAVRAATAPAGAAAAAAASVATVIPASIAAAAGSVAKAILASIAATAGSVAKAIPVSSAATAGSVGKATASRTMGSDETAQRVRGRHGPPVAAGAVRARRETAPGRAACTDECTECRAVARHSLSARFPP